MRGFPAPTYAGNRGSRLSVYAALTTSYRPRRDRGEFSWSSQHLDEEVRRWQQRFDRLAIPQRIGNCVNASGRPSLWGSRSRRQRRSLAWDGAPEATGSEMVAGCAPSVPIRGQAATSASKSARRSQCSRPKAMGCAPSHGSSSGRPRPSRVSWTATPGATRVASECRIGPAPPKRTRTAAPGARRRPSWSSTTSSVTTWLSDSVAPSPDPMARW